MAKVTKAVIPAAGAGTRLLPATKAQPKEMLPILDTPAIQHVVQEAVDSGIRDILIITGRDKRAIEDHFDRNPELETHLERKGEEGALQLLRTLGGLARIHYVRQPVQAGLGDAIGYSRAFVGEEPFAVLLGDTVFDAPLPVTRQLLSAFEEHASPIVAVEEVPREKVERYGIAEGTLLAGGMIGVEQLMEKPSPEDTDSNLAIAGRYILTPDIFPAIEATAPGRNGEIQLTDALATILPRTGLVAVPIQGRRFDIGNKLDYLRTVMTFALKHEDYAPVVRSFLESITDQGGEE